MEIEELKELSDEFLKEVGFTPYVAVLYNRNLDCCRFYKNKSSVYRLPKGWNKSDVDIISLEESLYPNIFIPENFIQLLEIQWDIIGSIGSTYIKNSSESFQETYIRTRIQGIKTAKSLGGGEVLDKYLNLIKSMDWIVIC